MLLAAAPPALGAAGDIRTIAGGGDCGSANNYGDGLPAVDACLVRPFRAVPAPGGGFLIADTGTNRVRLVDASGTIHTVAGSGDGGLIPGNYGGDGGQATEARLSAPLGVAPVAGGGFLIADHLNHRVRRVAADGTISTAVGGALGGDGCPATAASADGPQAVASTPGGGYLVAENSRVRRVRAGGGIDTVAGGGGGGRAAPGYSFAPADVSPLADGGFIEADGAFGRVRRVAPDGQVTTVAGGGVNGSGEGGPATQAELGEVDGVAAASNGGFVFSDGSNNLVRYVSPSGTISTIAGSGGAAGSTPALQARLDGPAGVALVPGGGVLVTDRFNDRVLFVDSTLEPAAPATTSSSLPTHLADFCDGLDPGFGMAGMSLVSGPPANAALLQPDGKLVLAGDGELVRLGVDGSPDAGFGSGGAAPTQIGSTTYGVAALARQTDGKLLATGAGDGGVSVLRFTAAGQLDPTFGDGGRTVVPLGGGSSGAGRAIAVQPDGRIVVGAMAPSGSPPGGFDLIRLLPSGQLDPDFGSGGVVFDSDAGVVGAVAVQPDGRIVLSGTDANQSIELRRYLPNGAPDASFGSAGVVLTDTGHEVNAPGLALQPDGRLVVAGAVLFPERMLIARYETSGALDTTFGAGGEVTLAPRTDAFSNDPTGASANAVALQPDGKLLVAGRNADGQDGTSYTLALARLTGDGALDATFGSGGRLFARVGHSASARGVDIDSDGRIVMGSYSSDVGMAAVRYGPNGIAPGADTTGAGPPPSTSGGPLGQPGTEPPAATHRRLAVVAVHRVRLSTLLRRGLPAVVIGGRPGQVKVTLRARWSSRARRRHARTLIAAARTRKTDGIRVRVRLVLRPHARHVLAHAARLRLKLVATDSAGARASRAVLVRRSR